MQPTASSDRLTIIAIAIIAYAGLYLTHEIIGHCGVAGLLGIKCTVLSSTHIPLVKEYSEIPTSTYNIILVAGSAANLMMALICFVLVRILPASPAARFFLWLSMTVNLFLAFSYMAVAPIIKIGDAYYLIYTLPNQVVWRISMSLVGGAACVLSFWLCLKELKKLIEFAGSAARATAWKLILPAYLAGGIVVVLSGLFSQGDPKWVLLQAAGGTFGLTAWLLIFPPFIPHGPASEEHPLISRSRGWIMAGALVGFIFVGVFGPGIRV